MANVLKGPGPYALTTSDSLLYTVPASTKTVVGLVITNVTAEQRVFRLHHVASGGSTAGNALFYDTILQPKQVITVRGLVMEAAHAIRGLANVAGSVNVSIAAVESS